MLVFFLETAAHSSSHQLYPSVQPVCGQLVCGACGSLRHLLHHLGALCWIYMVHYTRHSKDSACQTVLPASPLCLGSCNRSTHSWLGHAGERGIYSLWKQILSLNYPPFPFNTFSDDSWNIPLSGPPMQSYRQSLRLFFWQRLLALRSNLAVDIHQPNPV